MPPEARGDTERAIEHFRRAIDLNPGFPDPALNLGDLYLREGRNIEATGLFLSAIKVRPDFAAAYNFEAGNMGEFDVGLRATYIGEYDFAQVAGAPTTDGAGSRNFTNPFTSAPEWRANVNLDWTIGNM